MSCRCTCYQSCHDRETYHLQFTVEVPTQAQLLAVNPLPRAELVRFRSRHAREVIYQAAASLWAHGVSWSEAHSIAHDAYMAAQAGADVQV